MNYKISHPTKVVECEIDLPGSKSITNRVLLMSALGSGVTKVIDPLRSEDTDQMIKALIRLGVLINEGNENATFIEVKGTEHNFPNKNAKLFLGNSGTTFRPLTAVLAMMEGNYYLSGIERMHERPIKDLVDALEQMGSYIQYEKIDEIKEEIIKETFIKLRSSSSIFSGYSFIPPLLTTLSILPKYSNEVGEINFTTSLLITFSTETSGASIIKQFLLSNENLTLGKAV